jgi:hypothetical protein
MVVEVSRSYGGDPERKKGTRGPTLGPPGETRSWWKERTATSRSGPVGTRFLGETPAAAEGSFPTLSEIGFVATGSTMDASTVPCEANDTDQGGDYL